MRSPGMANPQMCKRYTEVPRSGKLLQKICKRFCRNCPTNAQAGEEGREMELGK